MASLSNRIAPLLVSNCKKSTFRSCAFLNRKFSSNSFQTNPDNVFYINRVLDNYTDKGLKKLTLRQLIFFGKNINESKLLTSANYVRTELPVRLAHRIRDFQALPFKVGINPHIQATYELYWDAFQKLKRVPVIQTTQDNNEFCKLLAEVLDNHLVVISKLALGMAECARHMPPQQIDEFMDKALMSRIARRVVAEQHIALTQQINGFKSRVSDKVGVVSIDCDPVSSIYNCANLARLLVSKSYEKIDAFVSPDSFPDLIVDGNTRIRFPFVQDHIDYVLFEVLKNSYQASLRQFERTGVRSLPIKVTLAEGSEEVIIRVTDHGGGFPTHQLKDMFSFARYDPARQSALENITHVSGKIETEPSFADLAAIPELGAKSDLGLIGRLGIGLPVSRNFMQYWGGSLTLTPLPGLGCNAYLRFPNGRIGAREHLPFDPSQADSHVSSSLPHLTAQVAHA